MLTEFNGFDVRFSASLYTLIVLAKDVIGSVMNMTKLLSSEKVNIATMSVDREGKYATACLCVELDEPLTPQILSEMERFSWIKNVYYINKLY